MVYIKFINLLKFNILAKKKYFYYNFNKKELTLINKFIELNVITSVTRPKTTHNKYRINLTYINNNILYKNIKLLYKPSKPVYIKLKTLKELKQYGYNSLYLLFTNNGLITNKEAIDLNIGGIIFCQLYL